ncbi:hypothetical protein GCM10011581_18790 [Saccharopolyspora subtropica]|uniref:DUF397 domain-containing protein n=2 Tax=Saccharopolyspora thermophila TaxID=89367 RepID=A0A917JQL4_9PSEU|nr:DUF397 domain-containing protein [Saccharopolyspora subtropica]GGI81572.1 hypothetical protein GCM10011581_18790 [Saccharopolyspora subtropica]
MDHNFSGTTWHKSSYSNAYGGDCVEVTLTPTAVGVRDSKNRQGGILVFSRDQWRAFLGSRRTYRSAAGG